MLESKKNGRFFGVLLFKPSQLALHRPHLNLLLHYRDLVAPNGNLLQEGDILKQPQLADTLHQIAENGINYFYNSSFTELMVEELQRDYGSIISVEDFHNYSSIERNVARAKYKGQEMVGVSPPAGGAVLGLILNILDGESLSLQSHSVLLVLSTSPEAVQS